MKINQEVELDINGKDVARLVYEEWADGDVIDFLNAIGLYQEDLKELLSATRDSLYKLDNKGREALLIVESYIRNEINLDEVLINPQTRPCIVSYNEEERKALFYGFCDNFDKCVVQYEDGELHKAYIWKVRFLDDKFNTDFNDYSEAINETRNKDTDNL